MLAYIQASSLPFFSNANDIASSPVAIQKHLDTSRVRPLLLGSTLDASFYGKDKGLGSARKVYIQISRKSNLNVGRLTVWNAPVMKAVATFEPKLLVQLENRHTKDYDLQSGTNSNLQVLQSSSNDNNQMDEREKLRRVRISKANKGNVPWNKGKKHSAETLRLIQERTKLAMQDPKVKMKLVNMGHAQSQETRKKIGMGVRIGWERRRKWLMVQETCYSVWENMIAEASRKGYAGEDELQWDSYNILDKQLKKEWLESIQRRKTMPRPTGSRRASKSPEQRKKISEAISAKWANPEYRNRVCAALSKYHGTPVGVERKVRQATGETSSLKRSPINKRAALQHNISGNEDRNLGKAVPRKKRNTKPSYEDPLADSKLEIIKKIREQRTTIETRKREAMERAKILIAEAEKAAKALEVAALKSPLARASLLEARKLITEATQSIQGIETGHLESCGGKKSSIFHPTVPMQHFREDPGDANGRTFSDKEVNGSEIISSSKSSDEDLSLDRLALEKLLDGTRSSPASGSKKRIPSGASAHLLPSEQLDAPMKRLPGPSDSRVAPLKINGADKGEELGVTIPRTSESSVPTTIRTKKKWVRGKLVEATED